MPDIFESLLARIEAAQDKTPDSYGDEDEYAEPPLEELQIASAKEQVISLISSDAIKRHIQRIASNFANGDENESAIVDRFYRFFSYATLEINLAQLLDRIERVPKPREYPSDKLKKMKRLRDQTRALCQALRRNTVKRSTTYLTGRLSSTNSYQYSSARGFLESNRQPPFIDAILETLANDLDEDIERLTAKIAAGTVHSRKWDHHLTSRLGALCIQYFGTTDTGLTTDLISAIAIDGVDYSTVDKRLRQLRQS